MTGPSDPPAKKGLIRAWYDEFCWDSILPFPGCVARSSFPVEREFPHLQNGGIMISISLNFMERKCDNVHLSTRSVVARGWSIGPLRFAGD